MKHLVILLVCTALYAEEPVASSEDIADVLQALRIFEAAKVTADTEDARRATSAFQSGVAAGPTEALGTAAQQAEITDVISPVSKDIATTDGITMALATTLIEVSREDIAGQIIAQSFIPRVRQIDDVNPADVQRQGPEGTVWIFWAQDAPHNDLLARQINNLRTSRPGLRVVDVHLMPLKRWLSLIGEMNGIREALTRNDPSIPDAVEVEAKYTLRDATVERWRGYTDMAKYNRVGGYPLIEDTTAAKMYTVHQLPAVRFISAAGVQHRRDGLSASDTLLLWVTRCETWEVDHLQEVLNHAK